MVEAAKHVLVIVGSPGCWWSRSSRSCMRGVEIQRRLKRRPRVRVASPPRAIADRV